MRAKFEGVGTPWGRKEFDQIYCDSEQVFRDKNCYHRTRLHSAELTSSHSAVLDVPSSAFAKELIAAYPEAKVILTVRDNVDVWYKYVYSLPQTTSAPPFLPPTTTEERSTDAPSCRSCCNTIVPASLGVGPKLLSYLDPVCALHGPTLSKYMYNFYGPRFTEEAATRRYRDHIAEVRRLVPEQNYLEFNVKRGWAPLCDFLGRDVPPTPFPRVNDTESFNDIFGPFFKDLLLQRMREWALWGAALGAVGVAIYWAALKR
ncbi:hypothetical protein MMC19_004038 [Ptychographa xylographoides]|nr:hypothetical protein [Ptychographa xylographoides]